MSKTGTAEGFHPREIAIAFVCLPRVLRLVWDASPSLVVGMTLVMLFQGITPLANVIVARLLIDGALRGITQGSLQPLLLPVILQLAINLAGRGCTRLHSMLEVLLNHRLSDHMTLLILRKIGTLDLA